MVEKLRFVGFFLHCILAVCALIAPGNMQENIRIAVFLLLLALACGMLGGWFVVAELAALGLLVTLSLIR